MPQTSVRRMRIKHAAPAGSIGQDGRLLSELYNTNALESPLLRLPAEIRQMIYNLVLGGQDMIHVNYRPHKFIRYDRNGRDHSRQVIKGGFYCQLLNSIKGFPKNTTKGEMYFFTGAVGFTLLSQVCRQLYTETSMIPMAQNKWSFASMAIANRFVREKCFSMAQRRVLKSIAIMGREIPSKKLVNYFFGIETLCSCSNLGDACLITASEFNRETNSWDPLGTFNDLWGRQS